MKKEVNSIPKEMDNNKVSFKQTKTEINNKGELSSDDEPKFIELIVWIFLTHKVPVKWLVVKTHKIIGCHKGPKIRNDIIYITVWNLLNDMLNLTLSNKQKTY